MRLTQKLYLSNIQVLNNRHLNSGDSRRNEGGSPVGLNGCWDELRLVLMEAHMGQSRQVLDARLVYEAYLEDLTLRTTT